MHLAPQQWYADQIRHNEMVINATILLRYPSVVVRTEERLVADQLARALHLSGAPVMLRSPGPRPARAT